MTFPLEKFAEAIEAATTLNVFLNEYDKELERLCDHAKAIEDDQQIREFLLLQVECKEWSDNLVDLMQWIQSERYETRMDKDREEKNENQKTNS